MALGYSNQRYGYFRNGTFWTTRNLSLRALLSATVGGFDHDTTLIAGAIGAIVLIMIVLYVFKNVL